MSAASSTARSFGRLTAHRAQAPSQVANGLAPGRFPRSGDPPEALLGWIVELPLPEPARLLLAILWRWRATKGGLVNPSIATLYLPARMAETTIQLRELEPKEDDRSNAKPQ
jgi:hypothetical protein